MSDELPADIRALIDADRRLDPEIPDDARRRILRNVGTAVLAGSAAGVAIGVGVKAAAGTGLSAFLADLFARKVSIAATAFLVGGAAGAGGYVVATKVVTVKVEAPAPVCPSVAVAVAPKGGTPLPKTAPVTLGPDKAVEPASEAAPSASTAAAPSASSAPVASVDDGEKKKRMLVEAARAAIARGDATNALDACDKYRAQGGGQLGEECEVVAIRALVLLGREAEAKARADGFRKKFPKSLYLPTIDATLGSQ